MSFSFSTQDAPDGEFSASRWVITERSYFSVYSIPLSPFSTRCRLSASCLDRRYFFELHYLRLPIEVRPRDLPARGSTSQDKTNTCPRRI